MFFRFFLFEFCYVIHTSQVFFLPGLPSPSAAFKTVATDLEIFDGFMTDTTLFERNYLVLWHLNVFVCISYFYSAFSTLLESRS